MWHNIQGYDHRLLAFIDILGFKKLINDNGHKAFDVADVLVSMKNAKMEIGTEHIFNDFKSTMFSDTVVLSVKDPINAVQPFLLRIAKFQGGLAQKGIFVRGSVTVGECHHDEQLIFGPAMVAAYEAEQSAARWPRITVDVDVLHLLSGKQNKQGKLLLMKRDASGIQYINYLRGYIDADKGEVDPNSFLSRHKNHVEKEANRNRKDPWILRKFHWLAVYHNSFVTKEGFNNKRIDLKGVFSSLY